MRDERPSCGTTGKGLQHRGFNLEESASFQRIADRAHNGDPLPGHRSSLRTDDQIDIALPDPGLFAHLLVRHGQRAQRLRGHLPRVGEDGQLPPAGTDHLAVDEDDIAEVDVGLPGIKCVHPDAGQADHRLQLGAVTFLEGGETQLAGIAGEHHPARHADMLTCGGVGRQFRICGSDLG